MRSKLERNQIITSEEKGRLRNHCPHGTIDMPVWGPLFASRDSKAVGEIRIHNLTTFVESMQEK